MYQRSVTTLLTLGLGLLVWGCKPEATTTPTGEELTPTVANCGACQSMYRTVLIYLFDMDRSGCVEATGPDLDLVHRLAEVRGGSVFNAYRTTVGQCIEH